MPAPSAPIIIKMPPAAADAKPAAPTPLPPIAAPPLHATVGVSPSLDPQGRRIYPPGTPTTPPAGSRSMNPLDRLVASTSPKVAGAPKAAAPKLTIAPGLLPLSIKSPPAAPVMAVPATARHPLGVGDVHDRLTALEVHVLTMFGQLRELMQDV
jgi:hypothetical protein